MKNAQVILLSILAACAYGVIHDQITIRLCLEYFTVAHPPLFHTTSPTLLALCWGVAATAGIGAVFGMVLALVSQSGPAPYPISRVARLILLLLTAMAGSAVVAGIVGYQLSQRGLISIPSGVARAIPEEQHHRFMAVWFAHGASYFVGLTGSAIVCFAVWNARGRPCVIPFLPRTRAATIRTLFLAVVAALVAWWRFGPR